MRRGLPDGGVVPRGWRKGLVGLDIGSRTVKAVELRRGRRACSLAAFAVAQLPEGAVDDGSIADREAVARAVRTLLDGGGFSTRTVALALAGNAVMVRRIELPAMGPTELEAAIHWEARQHVPYPAEEVELDYEVLRARGGPAAARSTGVLLVAARKQRVAEYTRVVEQAGCTPAVIDVDCLALLNAHELNYGSDDATPLALVDVGACAAGVTVVAGGQPVGTRALALGARSYLEALQAELGLGTVAAGRIVQAQPEDERTPDAARAVLGAVNDRIAAEIGDTLDLFRSSGLIDRIGALLLCGGASQVAGLGDALAARQQVPVGLLDPFRRVAGTSGRHANERPLAALAVGLALRQAGDR